MRQKIVMIDKNAFLRELSARKGIGRPADSLDRAFRRGLDEARLVFLAQVAEQARREADDARAAL